MARRIPTIVSIVALMIGAPQLALAGQQTFEAPDEMQIAAPPEAPSVYPAPIFGIDAGARAYWTRFLEVSKRPIRGHLVGGGASLVVGLSHEDFIPLLFRVGGGALNILSTKETLGFIQLEIATGGIVDVTQHVGIALELYTGIDTLLFEATGQSGGGLLVEVGGRMGVRVDLGGGRYVMPTYHLGFAGSDDVGCAQGAGLSFGFDMGRELAP